jgi:hypothetical protein
MSDKRSVHTDALATLGMIIDETAARDAIHLAVEPVIAGGYLSVGQDVGIGKDGKAYKQSDDMTLKMVGIVDPFLKSPVTPGKMFWLIVYPRTITSLRHVWEHPDFQPAKEVAKISKASKAEKEESEAWLKNFCATNDCPGYHKVMGAIEHEDYYDEYLHFEGSDAHGEIPNEFWNHVEVVMGRPVKRAKYFSCSC